MCLPRRVGAYSPRTPLKLRREVDGPGTCDPHDRYALRISFSGTTVSFPASDLDFGTVRTHSRGHVAFSERCRSSSPDNRLTRSQQPTKLQIAPVGAARHRAELRRRLSRSLAKTRVSFLTRKKVGFFLRRIRARLRALACAGIRECCTLEKKFRWIRTKVTFGKFHYNTPAARARCGSRRAPRHRARAAVPTPTLRRPVP